MAAAEGQGGKGEIWEEAETTTTTTGRKQLRDFIPIYVPTVEEGLMDHAPHEDRFLDFLRARPSRDWFVKFGFSRRFPPFFFPRHRGGDGGGGRSSSPDQTPATLGRSRFRVPFVRKIKWAAVAVSAKRWLKNPVHLALLLWMAAVFACLLLMGLLMSGALNEAMPDNSRRKKWLEVDNQVVNALFTILCLYEHPKLIHQLVLLLRWKEKDAGELRTLYSKNGAARPRERAHIAFVVALLHITCLAQYALCGLYWGYTRRDRPDVPVYAAMGVGIVAPVAAAVYSMFGPLRRKVAPAAEDGGSSEEAAIDIRQAEKLAARVRDRRVVVVTSPEWVGGLFDCWDDTAVAYASCFCTFCVFGWNMERLGFGNMYVHIATFLLFVISPLWVFNVAALNMENDAVRQSMRILGIALCFSGLLYGGFWRIRMRNKFKLPASRSCGSPNVTDCCRWLFCWACSLAQEVRTGNFYDIEEDTLYRTEARSSPSSEGEEDGRELSPMPVYRVIDPSGRPMLPRPDYSVRSYSWPAKAGVPQMTAGGGTTARVADFSPEDWSKRGSSLRVKGERLTMIPPVPPLMQTKVEVEVQQSSDGSPLDAVRAPVSPS